MLALLHTPAFANLVAMQANTGDVTSQVLNYGLAGVVLVLVMTGRLHTTAEVDRIQEALTKVREDSARQLAEAREETAALRVALVGLMTQVTSQTVPALERVTQVVDALPKAAERALADQMADLSAKLAKIEKANE